MSLKKATVLLVLVQLLICLSCLMVRAEAAQPDELWLKAVQFATQNQGLFSRKVHFVAKKRDFFGKWRVIEEEYWLRKTIDEGFKTEKIKSLANDRPENKSQLGEERIYDIECAELTFPFKLENQHKLTVQRLKRGEIRDGQHCAVYNFKGTFGESGPTEGKVWLNSSGIPVMLHYKFKLKSQRTPHQIHNATREVHYQSNNTGSWYPDRVLVWLKLKKSFPNLGTSLRLEYTFSEYHKTKEEELLSSGKRLTDLRLPYTVPFDYIGGNLYVKVRLNDHETAYSFLVDTGAGATVLNPQTAVELGLNKNATIQGSDGYVTRKNDLNLVMIEKISLGEVAVANCGAVVIDLKKIGAPIDGIIGSNFLSLFTVRIDYAQKRLTFSVNPDSYSEELVRSYQIRLNQDPTGLIYAPLQLSGVKTLFQAEIDTGYGGGSLSVPSSLMERFKPGLNCPVVKSQGNVTGGVFGEAEGMFSRIGEFALGELSLKNIMVSFDGRQMETLLLGNQILSQFTVVIDYPKSIMYLLPLASQTFETNLMSHGFGVKQNTDGKSCVRYIWEGSPAYRGGLRVGDIILRAVADGNSVTSYDEIKNIIKKDAQICLYVQRDSGETELVLKKEPLLPEVE